MRASAGLARRRAARRAARPPCGGRKARRHARRLAARAGEGRLGRAGALSVAARCSTAVPASRKERRAAPARVRRAVGVGAAAPGQRTACWKGRERRSPPGARRQRKRRPPSQITVERVERTCPERSGRDRGGQEACTHTRTVAVRGRHRRRDPRHAKMYSRPARSFGSAWVLPLAAKCPSRGAAGTPRFGRRGDAPPSLSERWSNAWCSQVRVVRSNVNARSCVYACVLRSSAGLSWFTFAQRGAGVNTTLCRTHGSRSGAAAARD